MDFNRLSELEKVIVIDSASIFFISFINTHKAAEKIQKKTIKTVHKTVHKSVA